MNRSSAGSVVDYQDRSLDYSIGDTVITLDNNSVVGRVTRVYPAIGMVDVEFHTGNHRIPVEDLKRVDEDDFGYAPKTDSTVGGEIDLTPFGDRAVRTTNPANSFDTGVSKTRVSKAWVKKALYWAAKDRKYRATRSECGSHYTCPKCPEVPMKKAIYKRMDGFSERLWGCPSCMFLIKNSDIVRFDGGV